MPASSTSRRSITFRLRSGTRSWRSICPRRSTRRGWCSRRCERTNSAASSTSPRRTGSSHRPSRPAYVAAKHGMVGLTKVTALEAAENNITCNAICPGYVYTPLVEAQIEGQANAHGIPREQVTPRRAARAAAEQALRHGGRAGRTVGVSGERCRGIDHWNGAARRRRLDRALSAS